MSTNQSDLRAAESAMDHKPVAVVFMPVGAARGVVVERFESIAQAEAYVAELAAKPDWREAVIRGDYGIDAPETMLNPRHSEPR